MVPVRPEAIPFAGKTAELRFEFRSPGCDDFFGTPAAQSHVLDDLKFSALPPNPVAAEVTRRKAAFAWDRPVPEQPSAS